MRMSKIKYIYKYVHSNEEIVSCGQITKSASRLVVFSKTGKQSDQAVIFSPKQAKKYLETSRAFSQGSCANYSPKDATRLELSWITVTGDE